MPFSVTTHRSQLPRTGLALSGISQDQRFHHHPRMTFPRTLLLIGSSIMEQWHQPASLSPGANWRVVNRAIGGTTSAFWAENLPSILADERPHAALAYVGSNDFAQDIPAATIAATNKDIRAVLDPADLWFETDAVFLEPDGSPVSAHYVEDGLHLTPAAYTAFTPTLLPRLHDWLAHE